MSYTITQQATSPNAAYTRLLYAVSGSIYTTQPQFQYVMDVYESGSNNLIKRTTQTINPAGVAIFDPSRIIQGELSVDYNWKINSVTGFNSSSKEFIIEFGEQFGTSISSSVTVYPTIASSSIETFQGVVEPNAGYYNWDSGSYAVLSNMPATMSMQSNDFGTVSLYNNTVGYVSQSFYSASIGAYVKVDEKNYSITDNFSSVPISASTPYWNYVDVNVSSSVGLESYRYEASDETHREKTRFAFVNKLGAWDYYNNYNPVRQRINVSRQEYTAPRVDYSSLNSTYDISRRGKTVNNSSTDDQFTVDTDYLDKTNANWLEELIESPEVYIQRNGEFIPIVITDSGYTAKTSAGRQKLFKYTINFKPSNQPFGTWIPEYVQCPKELTVCQTVNTNTPATDITPTSMTISAQLTASLAQDIQEIGFVYSTSSVNPTIADTKQESPGITYPVTSRVFNLNTGPAFTCNSTVYYRGYASSSISGCELVYGPVSNATTLGCEPIPTASYWYTSNYRVDQTADDWRKRSGSEGGQKFEFGGSPNVDSQIITGSVGGFTLPQFRSTNYPNTPTSQYMLQMDNMFNINGYSYTSVVGSFSVWCYVGEWDGTDGQTGFFEFTGGTANPLRIGKVSISTSVSGSGADVKGMLTIHGKSISGTSLTQRFPTAQIQTGSWNYITYTQDGGNFNGIKVYINNSVAYQPTGSGVIDYTPVTGTIKWKLGGGDILGNNRQLRGNIVGATIYGNRVLTQAEVAENYLIEQNYFSSLT